MSISLTTEKACKVKDACATLLNNPSATIREVSQVLGRHRFKGNRSSKGQEQGSTTRSSSSIWPIFR